MKHIKAVIFDCDGVLFDSQDANTAYYNRILAKFDRLPMTPEETAYAHMHTALEVIAHLFPDPAELSLADAARREMGYAPFISLMRLEPDAKALLAVLRPRMKTAIATNRADTMAAVLHTHRLDDQFDLVVTSKDVAQPKPAPEMLLLILNHFGITAPEALFIGDSELDEAAARSAGIPFAAFRNLQLTATHHINSFTELRALLAPDS